MEEREPYIMICCGTKGVGKTYRTLQEINHYLLTTPTKKGRKVLVFDVNAPMERSYSKLRTVDVENVKLLKRIEARRVISLNKDTTPMTIDQKVNTCYKILETYTNGLLVLEDINNYVLGAKAVPFIGTITTNRHKDLDIIIHLQSLSPIDPRLWQNCTVIRFHYQSDNIDRYKNRIPNYELLKLAQLIVNAQYYKGNTRYFCYVMNLENRIIGVNLEAFKKACEEYLMLNKRILSDLMFLVGNNGLGKKHGQKLAIEEFVKRKMHYITPSPKNPTDHIDYVLNRNRRRKKTGGLMQAH